MSTVNLTVGRIYFKVLLNCVVLHTGVSYITLQILETHLNTIKCLVTVGYLVLMFFLFFYLLLFILLCGNKIMSRIYQERFKVSVIKPAESQMSFKQMLFN